MENEKPQAPELVVLPLQLMNDLMSYLGTKPHTEVEPYIMAIRKECRVVPREEVSLDPGQHKMSEPKKRELKIK